MVVAVVTRANLEQRTFEAPAEQLNAVKDVLEERIRQDELWGGPSHDDRHGPISWVAFIEEHNDKARAQLEENGDHFGGHYYIDDAARERYRRRLVEVGALALAAIESLDRETSS